MIVTNELDDFHDKIHEFREYIFYLMSLENFVITNTID